MERTERTTMRHNYHKISEELQNRIKEDMKNHYESPYRCNDEDIVRRNMERDQATLWRPAFQRDIEKILHIPYYCRYTDKTQVFSFINNDDISRRALHVQLVARIARNIGRVLGLNEDLIEAMALGHDIGHTPFGHAGERYLNDVYHARTGRYFNHNVQSARVLDKLFQRNISLQVLDGVLCHNGEFEQKEYRPNKGKTFEDLDREIEACYTDGPSAIKLLVPTTLEGCVVRISDMIAYIGKDRQDALTAKIIDHDTEFSSESIGDKNAEIINNLSVDIIENSYGKDYILLSEAAYNDLKTAKRENYEMIYLSEDTQKEYDSIIGPMFEKLYDRLYEDVVSGDEDSIIYRHHIKFINNNNYDRGAADYREEDKHQIVVDFISSMTDDYFIALYNELFPEDKKDIKFKTYF